MGAATGSQGFLTPDVMSIVAEFVQPADCCAFRHTCAQWRRIGNDLAAERMAVLRSLFATAEPQAVLHQHRSGGRRHCRRNSNESYEDSDGSSDGDPGRDPTTTVTHGRTLVGTSITVTCYLDGRDDRHTIDIGDVTIALYTHHHQSWEYEVDEMLYFNDGLRVVLRAGEMFDAFERESLLYAKAPPAVFLLGGCHEPGAQVENHPSNGRRWLTAVRMCMERLAAQQGVFVEEMQRCLPQSHRLPLWCRNQSDSVSEPRRLSLA